MNKRTQASHVTGQVGPYGNQFYVEQSDGSLRSARLIIPLVLEMVKPISVADVGCGVGAWLVACQENGVSDVDGFDGSYVNPDLLRIEPERFHSVDLKRPVYTGRKYDLALCMEVAEHLPARSAPSLISSLVRLAPVVLFSAAIPGQGGTCHINEQWPDYWETLFAQHGFRRLDAVRPSIWQDARIEWWYRQNTYLFALESVVETSPGLSAFGDSQAPDDIQLIHRGILGQYKKYDSVVGLLRHFPVVLSRALLRRLSNVR